jgi:hypothetical protein
MARAHGAGDRKGGRVSAAPNDEAALDAAEERNRVATLRAQLAMHGFELQEARGAFFVSRWDRTAHCIGVDALRAFLARLGPPPR